MGEEQRKMDSSRLGKYDDFLYKVSLILTWISVTVSFLAAVFFYPPFHIFWEAVRLPVRESLEICTVPLFASSGAFLLMSLKKHSHAPVTLCFLACVTVSAAVTLFSRFYSAFSSFPYIASSLYLCFLPLFAVSFIAEKKVVSHKKGYYAAAVLGLIQIVLSLILFIRSLSASVLTGTIQYLYFIPIITLFTPFVLLFGADRLTVSYRFTLLAASLFLPVSLIRIADTVLMCRIVPFYAGALVVFLLINYVYNIFQYVKERKLWQTS